MAKAKKEPEKKKVVEKVFTPIPPSKRSGIIDPMKPEVFLGDRYDPEMKYCWTDGENRPLLESKGWKLVQGENGYDKMRIMCVKK